MVSWAFGDEILIPYFCEMRKLKIAELSRVLNFIGSIYSFSQYH